METEFAVRSMHETELIGNHLEFLNAHRGRVQQEQHGWTVRSSRKEYTFAIPGADSSLAALVAEFDTFYLMPDACVLEQELEEMGFIQSGALNYLTRNIRNLNGNENAILDIVTVNNADMMETFSRVQTLGFTDTPQEYLSWYLFLREANFHNEHHKQQRFYMAFSGSLPVGVSLVVKGSSYWGIYAVTALPGHRRQGVASTLLKRIAEEAEQEGISRLTLQAAHGSYAEFFFQKLGFSSCFLVKILSRNGNY